MLKLMSWATTDDERYGLIMMVLGVSSVAAGAAIVILVTTGNGAMLHERSLRHLSSQPADFKAISVRFRLS